MRGYGPSFSSPPLYLGSFSLFLIFHFSDLFPFPTPLFPSSTFLFTFYFLLLTSIPRSAILFFRLPRHIPPSGMHASTEYLKKKKCTIYSTSRRMLRCGCHWMPLGSHRLPRLTGTISTSAVLGCGLLQCSTV